MKCPKCETENTPDSQFCKKCAMPLPFSKEMPAPQTETLRTPIKELTTGSTFAGRYQVIEELGKGGMGRVYKVFDTKIKEKVALKLIKPEIASDEETIERFSNELRLARKIGHRNVCRMFDMGETEGAHFITMEYVHGEDLKSMIRMAAGLSIGAVLSIGKQVCDGLAEAHSLGVIHRDLKPQNIMIDRGGNAKIMDFGIARSLREKGITAPSVLIGTPEYMSPEQAEAKEVDHRSDIYTLGIILYEMATGRVPFEGDTALSIAMKHKGENPKNPKQFNPNIPDDLSAVILKCLEKDKAERYQAVSGVRSELEKIEKGIPTTERVAPDRKPLTSREITVKFNLKKLLIPGLVVTALVIAAVIIIGRVAPRKETPPAESPGHSIAVLPFEDLSPKKEYRYLCDGIAETLINTLTGIKDLWVPARASSFSFEGKNPGIREIGRQLGVDNLLEASVQVVGNRLRITPKIIHVNDGAQIWSGQYDRQMEDVFAIQDEIAREIVKALKIKLLGEKESPLAKRYTENREAYELYLQGRYLWNKRGKANLEKAAAFFEESVRKDPNYALGYGGLADSYYVMGNNGFLSTAEALSKAKTAALKALELDPYLAEALACLGSLKTNWEWDFPGAEKDFKRAIELKPGYATAHQWYAFLLARLGRFEEMIAEISRASELDPLSTRIRANVGYMYYYTRRYDRAIAELEKAREMDPNHSWTYQYLGYACVETGLFARAKESFLRYQELEYGDAFEDEDIAYLYARMGRKKEARQLLAKLKSEGKPQQRPISPTMMAAAYGVLGEKDEAFAWLEKAYQGRDLALGYLKVRPTFDSLRSDQRFSQLLKRIRLEK